jgi:hypothetical protein
MTRVKVDVKMYPWAVRRALEDIEPKCLSEAGKLTMRVARGFVRQKKNPNIASAPGTPIHSHKNGKNPGFKKTIVWALRPDKKAVWIGPQKVSGGLTNISQTHEFGGHRKVVYGNPKLLDGVEIGDIAPVCTYQLTGLDKVLRKDKNNDPKSGSIVLWIKIRTKTQAEHSSRLYYRMCKHYNTKTLANYPKRPFMRPSLLAVLPKLPYFWKGAIRSS